MDDYQQRVLEHLFSQTSKPTVLQREEIANQIGVSPKMVQSWFLERRAKAKADKIIEERQTLDALENAHQISPHEAAAACLTRPVNYRTQSAASYASLHRAISAARQCMPSEFAIDSSIPPSPSDFSMDAGFPLYSPMESSFAMSSCMARSESQYSTFTTNTPGDFQDLSEFPFLAISSAHVSTPSATNDSMVYQDPDFTPRPAATRVATRPTLQRTWTAPESMSRPVSRKAMSSSFNENSMAAQPMRVKRRNPKLSQLGVNMARSRSSLGYEQSEFPYSVRRSNVADDFQEVPITPVRRIASGMSLASGDSFSSVFSMTPIDSSESSQDSPAFSASMPGLQFPPSPITPEHQHSFYQQNKGISTFDQHFSTNADLTPPPTPLATLSASAQNSLVGSGYEDTWASDLKLTGLDMMSNDVMLTDIFNDSEFVL